MLPDSISAWDLQCRTVLARGLSEWEMGRYLKGLEVQFLLDEDLGG